MEAYQNALEAEIPQEALTVPENDEEIEETIKELLDGDPDDLDEIEEYIDEVEMYYSGELREFAFREAIRCGAINYVEANANEFDLNDEDDFSSSYLYETDDEAMQQLLIQYGASRPMDDYSDYRFARETLDGTIISFDKNFQKEVFEKYLTYTGLTREMVLKMLINGVDAYAKKELPENARGRSLTADFEAMGLSVDEEKLTFNNMYGESGGGTEELLEELGYSINFEGSSWKLETDGVRYVE